MGCCGGKKDKYPTLICFFETKNEEQKAYCIKLKDNFRSDKTIIFEIKSLPNVPCKIQFKKDGITTDLQTEYSNEEDVMNETLQKAYDLLKD